MSETKDAKTAPGWDGEADPVTDHGGDWFWGGTPPPEPEPQVKSKETSKTAKS